ncbi:hypothetical protein BCR34DRAFT_584250 [Clohesyomyces aquaticus]|uniref:F-box domain-containing protein n=1 Tax=Clohesyomyces aquaticus TaxID=1231657 RepID=A0A1Y2A260_9PLEO|nr:hypothetical protein BCR34DRAFT_584250 [Clohesyomyces aquaticus]
MGSGGAVSAGVRFLCHLPLFMLAIFGTANYTYVQKHAQILLAPPYNKHKILTAEGLSGPGACVAVAWNFIFWIPTIMASNRKLLYFGIVDAAIVSCLSYALYIESTFVSLTRPRCATVHANATADPHLLFFDRAGMINMTNTDLGKSICNRFLAKWYMALVITILYFFSAFFNLFAGIFFSEDSGYSSGITQRRHNPIRGVLSCISFPLVILWETLLQFLTPFYNLLPESMRTSFRYRLRLAGRWTWNKTSFATSKVITMGIHLPRYLRKSKTTDEKLAQLLLASEPYDILQLIAGQLHYVDLVNLSLVSKRVRAAIFPSLEDSAEDRQLRFYSCEGDKKTACWTCGIQVCQVCLKLRNAKDSITSFHMRCCEARCSKCFREALVPVISGHFACACYRDGHTSYVSGLYRHSQSRYVCRDCNKLNDKKLCALREERDKEVYRRLTTQSLACAKCKELLPRTGMRWWVHTQAGCGRECRASCHPGYIEKTEV